MKLGEKIQTHENVPAENPVPMEPVSIPNEEPEAAPETAPVEKEVEVPA